jgi:hypothetical protein
LLLPYLTLFEFFELHLMAMLSTNHKIQKRMLNHHLAPIGLYQFEPNSYPFLLQEIFFYHIMYLMMIPVPRP